MGESEKVYKRHETKPKLSQLKKKRKEKKATTRSRARSSTKWVHKCDVSISFRFWFVHFFYCASLVKPKKISRFSFSFVHFHTFQFWISSWFIFISKNGAVRESVSCAIFIEEEIECCVDIGDAWLSLLRWIYCSFRCCCRCFSSFFHITEVSKKGKGSREMTKCHEIELYVHVQTSFRFAILYYTCVLYAWEMCVHSTVFTYDCYMSIKSILIKSIIKRKQTVCHTQSTAKKIEQQP